MARTAARQYFLVPSDPSNLGPGSKSVELSSTGDLAVTKNMTIESVTSIGIKEVAYGLLAPQRALPPRNAHTLKGQPDGLAVALSPVVAGAATQFEAAIAGGLPQIIDIDKAASLVGIDWLPWEGRPTQPPALREGPGIPAIDDADAEAIDPDFVYGAEPERGMRLAAMAALHSPITRCAHMAQFVAGLANDPSIARPLSVALAAASEDPDTADSADLLAIREHIPEFISQFRAVTDSIHSVLTNVSKGRKELTDLGLAAGHIETGRILARAVAQAQPSLAPAPAPALRGRGCHGYPHTRSEPAGFVRFRQRDLEG